MLVIIKVLQNIIFDDKLLRHLVTFEKDKVVVLEQVYSCN